MLFSFWFRNILLESIIRKRILLGIKLYLLDIRNFGEYHVTFINIRRLIPPARKFIIPDANLSRDSCLFVFLSSLKTLVTIARSMHHLRGRGERLMTH